MDNRKLVKTQVQYTCIDQTCSHLVKETHSWMQDGLECNIESRIETQIYRYWYPVSHNPARTDPDLPLNIDD